MKHTFVIPAYKNSGFLEECIRSLQKQTVPSTIIIASSTPSDFLAATAGKYGIEIRYNENTGGIADDWNFAYRICQTDYVTLAHQDDVYLPDYTEKCLAAIEKKGNSDTLLVFTDYRIINATLSKGTSFIILVKKLLLLPFLLKSGYRNRVMKRGILVFGNPVSCPTVMFNARKIGPFEFSREYRYNLDWEAWLRLSDYTGKFIYINRKLQLHRIHSESQTISQISDNNRAKEEEMIFGLIWKKPFARMIFSLYRYAARLNVNALD
jgi:glycosyltransferase involved in cell wall biosynthesis